MEIRVSHRTDTNENVLIDFRTQTTQLQVEKVPIEPIQSIITIVKEEDYSAPFVTEITTSLTTQLQIVDESFVLENF